MKLFLISQDQNDDYDTYDSAVVAASDEETARSMDPANGKPIKKKNWGLSWCDGPEYVTVRYLGEAVDDVEQGIICASYNSG